MHHLQSKETETAPSEWQSAWNEDASDTLLLAETLIHIAASTSSELTPESLEMAVAVYQATARLRAPPVYETDGATEIEKFQDRLKSVEEELRATKAETSRVFLALDTKLNTLMRLLEAQTVRFDTTAIAIEEETQKCSAIFEELNSRFDSVAKEVSTLMVAVETAEVEAATPAQAEINSSPGSKELAIDEEWTQVRHDAIPSPRSHEKGKNNDSTVKGGEGPKDPVSKNSAKRILADSKRIGGRRGGGSIDEGTTSKLAAGDKPVTVKTTEAAAAASTGGEETKSKNENTQSKKAKKEKKRAEKDPEAIERSNGQEIESL